MRPNKAHLNAHIYVVVCGRVHAKMRFSCFPANYVTGFRLNSCHEGGTCSHTILGTTYGPQPLLMAPITWNFSQLETSASLVLEPANMFWEIALVPFSGGHFGPHSRFLCEKLCCNLHCTSYVCILPMWRFLPDYRTPHLSFCFFSEYICHGFKCQIMKSSAISTDEMCRLESWLCPFLFWQP